MSNSKDEKKVCTICGKRRSMTYEHIPPKSAGNNKPVKGYNGVVLIGEQLSFDSGKKPWDFDGIKYNNMQRGMVFKTICKDCNNNGGSWYVPHYTKFIDSIQNETRKEEIISGSTLNIEVRNIRPLAVIKQVISMFLSIDHPSTYEEIIHEFVKNPESNLFPDNKYSIYMYLFIGSVQKFVNKTAMGLDEGIILVAEIATIPVGFVMNFGKKTNRIRGIDITHFTKFDYEDIISEVLVMPVLESHILFPLDYRTKSEIDKFK